MTEQIGLYKYVDENGVVHILYPVTRTDAIDAVSDLPMGGFKVTGLGTPTADGDAVPLGYANKNFAPAGFGLGKIQPIKWSDIDNITANGWYSALVNGEVAFGINAYMAWIRVDGLDTNYAHQTIFITGSDCVLHRHKDGGAWGPMECDNPPMLLGVEYRTTERWGGKPVYVKAINCGVVADSKTITDTTTSNVTNVIRYAGTMGTNALPLPEYNVFIRVGAIGGQLTVVFNGGSLANSGETGYAHAWYVKG